MTDEKIKSHVRQWITKIAEKYNVSYHTALEILKHFSAKKNRKNALEIWNKYGGTNE